MKKIILLFLFLNLSLLKIYAQHDLSEPFKKCNLNGSTTIYDYKAKKWISSDINDSHFPTLPASTFKIINTLIALETGEVADENYIIKWPGFSDTVKYGYRPDIYHDMNLKEAFKVSAVWYYLDIARKIGKEKYKEYLTACNYGNVDLSIDDIDFWNFGNLAISPVNQIEILLGIYEESLPFKKENFAILKNIMIEEQTKNYTLRSKTGWTRVGDKDTGWWVGYVERSDNVYFFATRLIKDRKVINNNFSRCRREITKTILKQLSILD